MSARLPPVLRLLRPNQWIKNGFVLAPAIFSGRIMNPGGLAAALGALVAFSLAASGAYALNDVADRERDRLHPRKRLRPVASGEIGVNAALAIGAVCLVAGLVVALAIRPLVLLFIGGYVVLNFGYTIRLKDLVLVDVFTVAAFFVLRLLAGSAAVEVEPSVWLLLCGGLLALFLGFAKRRHELLELGDDSAAHRGVLRHYSAALLDQLSAVLLAVTIVSYVMYTIESTTARQVGDALTWSTAFVIFGVARYLYLVHQRRTGNPMETLMVDPQLQVAVLLWAGYCSWVITRSH